MKKVFSILTMFAVALATGFFSADKAEAIPAFARQMQMTCKSCHFQHFPKLNAFGRAFKVNGYTDVAVDTINGDWGSSIPTNLNMAYVTKMRYLKNVDIGNCRPCDQADRGDLQITDEATLWVGGRVAEHIGAAIEIGNGANAQHWGSGTIVFGHDLESLHTHVGLAIWATDGAGPFWGKEIFNTGLVRGARGWENRDLTQAAAPIYRDDLNTTGTTNEASGLTLYAGHEWFFASLGAWTVGFNGVDVGADMAGIFRFALTPPQIFGFDTMIGTYGTFGSFSHTDRATKTWTDTTVDTTGLDFQAQGNVTEGITLEITGNMLLDTGKPSTRNIIRRGTGADIQRYQFGFDLGFLNDRLISKFNYLHASARGRNSTPGSVETAAGTAGWNRESFDAVSLGLYYNIRENVSLRPEISWIVGSSTDPTYNNAGMRRNGAGNDTEFILMLMYGF